MMVGMAAGFVLASMLQRVEHENEESPEMLIDSLEDKLNALERAAPALN